MLTPHTVGCPSFTQMPYAGMGVGSAQFGAQPFYLLGNVGFHPGLLLGNDASHDIKYEHASRLVLLGHVLL